MDTFQFRQFISRPHHFSIETFLDFMLAGHIVDGRGGGLVIGRSHDEGNIYLISQTANDPSRFTFTACLEGGEYLVNHRAYQSHRARLHAINQDRGDTSSLPAIKPAAQTRIINTVAEPFDKIILMDWREMFIANKFSTAAHLAELERINDSASDFAVCDLGHLGFPGE